MKRIRLTKKAALLNLEQAEGMTFGGMPEEWAPFGEEIFFAPIPIEVDEDDEGEEIPSFSHFVDSKMGVRRYIRTFSSVKDFCEQPFANAQNEKIWADEEHTLTCQDRSHLEGGNLAWYGAVSIEEAKSRAFKGWPEGGDRVRRMMGSMDIEPPSSLRRKVQHADQGDELDIHAVYRGSLDSAWTRRRRDRARSRMNIRIIAQLGGSHTTTVEEMFWRGAAVLKLTELLEESGYRVEVLGVDHHGRIDPSAGEQAASAICSFPIKEAGAPLDVEEVAGVVCNAGFFRTYGFRSAYAAVGHELRPAQKVTTRDGRKKTNGLLSRAYVGNDDVVPILGLDDGTKLFNVSLYTETKEKAVEWVKQCLAELEAE